MQIDLKSSAPAEAVAYYGGAFGAVMPFIVFVGGVVTIALSGAPDERGFWPVLILALGLGLLLARDKAAFSRVVIGGMSQQIVMIMVMAWILASTIGVLMTVTGFVEALIWLSTLLDLNSTSFVLASFVICCIVSLSTGSSFATILICGPILYPAGGLMGAHLPVLAGAILGGATFGDFTAPISDTTIASALSQNAGIGQTVRSRLKYVIPAWVAAAVAYYVFNRANPGLPVSDINVLEGSPNGLPMLLVPVLIIALFLKGRHLVHGLLMGLLFGIALALISGLMPFSEVLSLDPDNFSATSFIIKGIERAVGISIFTILLMGLVASLVASGLIDSLVAFAERRSHSSRHAEGWIASIAGAAVLLTTHSVVAILTVADFTRKTGQRMQVMPVRRANILSLVACVFPFLLPYFIPVILMANMTSSGEEYGLALVSPLETGLYNFIAWSLLAILALVVLAGFGRKADNSEQAAGAADVSVDG